MASPCKTQAQRKAQRRAAQPVVSFFDSVIEPPLPMPRLVGTEPLRAKIPGVWRCEVRDGIMHVIRTDEEGK